MSHRVALDAAGGDFGLAPNIDGAIRAVNSWNLTVTFVGPAAQIKDALAARGISAQDKRFEVVDAPEVVGMNEDPVAACREKAAASINVAAGLVAQGRAQAVVSAGNSGATMVACLWHLKRIPGILRPAIAVALPNPKGASLLLDCGANMDCKPWHLVQFAAMGSIYAKHILKAPQPKVGILSIGEEDCKGNETVKEAIPLLRSSGLSFHGPVEGRDLTNGAADVIVCDGFVGNVAVKLVEGNSSMIFSVLKSEIAESILCRAGAFLMKGAFRRLKKRLSYEDYGGGPLLGINGTAIICHGRSSAKAIANALRVAGEMVDSGINEKIRQSLESMKSKLETVEA